ncbi:IS256 family transposase [Tautonia plasticadhaerens]|uniref:Mutator family transposase n=1 Tax=Tautonia plasticadhaerens TaxID=2527974 RepID=A0A518HDD5_9BACT|nr:IS256 family transposase [Tautonia plasticadhaerens]QDV38868.1 Transposase, Mutator family [Tautonia plasticadhaerens]
MTHQMQPTALDEITELLAEHGFDGLASAITILLNEVMKIERAHALGAAPYQRSERRTGHANGFKPKTLHTRLGPLGVEVPQTRGVAFYPSALEKGVRSERALKLAVAEMDVQGVSTRKVAAITEKLCGLEVTSGEVSRAAEALDEELERWRSRPLGETPYLILDARYEHVRHGGQVVSCAVLTAIGIDTQGKRSILGVSVSLSEAEAHWRDFLASLQARGLHGVKLVVADAHAGLKEALKARLTGVPWQRCQFHLIENAMAFVPKPGMRKAVVASLRAVFDAPDRTEAERQLDIAVRKYRATAPRLAEWLEANVPEGLAVFALPPSHRRRLRTINMLERLNKELKRRTRVAGLFPNEASALRLVSAVAMEISEDWETNRRYLTMEPE